MNRTDANRSGSFRFVLTAIIDRSIKYPRWFVFSLLVTGLAEIFAKIALVGCEM